MFFIGGFKGGEAPLFFLKMRRRRNHFQRRAATSWVRLSLPRHLVMMRTLQCGPLFDNVEIPMYLVVVGKWTTLSCVA